MNIIIHMEVVKIFLVFFFGVATGIAVNYFSDILPWRRRIARPICLFCQKDHPLFNYFVWPRKCPNCGKLRSYRTWLVELFFGIAAIWLWFYHPVKLGFWGGFVILAYFAVVAVIDIEHRLILHPVSLFGAGMGFVIGIYLHGLQATLFGGLFGFGSMLFLYWLGGVLLRILAKIRGEIVDDVALGFGDVILSGVLGLIIGFPGVIVSLFLAILIGGVVSFVYLLTMLALRKYKVFSALPYGPFLIAGAVILIFFRDFLVKFF